MKKKIKIGIALSSTKIEAWKYATIEKCIAFFLPTKIDIYLIANKSTEQKTIGKYHPAKIHQRIDNIIFPSANSAFEKKDIYSFKNVNIIEFDSQKNKIDLLLYLDHYPISEELFTLASLGIFYFDFGNKAINNQIPAYHEFVNKEETIQANLVFQQSKHGAIKTAQNTSTMADFLSINRGANEHYWKLSTFFTRELKKLQAAGFQKYIELLTNHKTKQIHLTEISYSNSISSIFVQFLRLGKQAIQNFFYHKQWLLFIAFDSSFPFDFKKLKKIPIPKDRFWADPFVISKNDKHYLFIEELPFATNKGHLSVLEMDKNGNCSKPKIILEKAYHLSYPFIFEYEGKYWMIPESWENHSIQLYECINFPYEWKHKMNLMEGLDAVDSTLLYNNKKWWLFTNIAQQKGSSLNDELFLFYADSPISNKWTAHPMNPIISNNQLARPAGNIFKRDGKLYRPSQDCSRKYGYGFNLNEIEILTETEYQEKLFKNIRPDWNKSIKRTHTYQFVNGLLIIDGMLLRRKWF